MSPERIVMERALAGALAELEKLFPGERDPDLKTWLARERRALSAMMRERWLN